MITVLQLQGMAEWIKKQELTRCHLKKHTLSTKAHID